MDLFEKTRMEQSLSISGGPGTFEQLVIVSYLNSLSAPTPRSQVASYVASFLGLDRTVVLKYLGCMIQDGNLVLDSSLCIKETRAGREVAKGYQRTLEQALRIAGYWFND